MSYDAQEGVDYIVDLYKVSGVAHDADPAEVGDSIKQRMREFHPDRLQGLAPEFVAKGERITRLLNRARAILLDPAKRQEYDEILSSWDGPVSKDGTPVITMSRHVQAEMEMMSPEEIEAVFGEQARQADMMSGNATSQLSFLERMVGEAGAEAPEDMRIAYEQALLARDVSLAVQENARLELLTIADGDEPHFDIGVDHAD